jgi:hypothetical protein
VSTKRSTPSVVCETRRLDWSAWLTLQYQPLPTVGKCSYDKMTEFALRDPMCHFFDSKWTENYNQPLSLSTGPTTQYYIANFFSKPLRIWRDTLLNASSSCRKKIQFLLEPTKVPVENPSEYVDHQPPILMKIDNQPYSSPWWTIPLPLSEPEVFDPALYCFLEAEATLSPGSGSFSPTTTPISNHQKTKMCSVCFENRRQKPNPFR